MNLIGLSGYARSGKDTVAGTLIKHGYQRVGFADALRDVALALDPMIDAPTPTRLSDLIAEHGWEHSKDTFPDVRRLLQRLGTDVGRSFFGDNVWVQLAMAKVTGPTVFTDCRFVNEADAIKAAGGQVWRVHRDGYGPVNGHVSETALDDYQFDRLVWNDGTIADLDAKVSQWLQLAAGLDMLDRMPVTRWTEPADPTDPDPHIIRSIN